MLATREALSTERPRAPATVAAPRIYAVPSAGALGEDRVREIVRLHFDWVEIPLSLSKPAGDAGLVQLRAAAAGAGRAGLNVMIALD